MSRVTSGIAQPVNPAAGRSICHLYIQENHMEKISIRKVQKLKTTTVALYPIWECWPF